MLRELLRQQVEEHLSDIDPVRLSIFLDAVGNSIEQFQNKEHTASAVSAYQVNHPNDYYTHKNPVVVSANYGAADNDNTPFEVYDHSHRHLKRSQEIAKVGSYELEIPDGDFSAMQPVYWSDELNRILGYAPGTQLFRESFLRRVCPKEMVSMKETLNEAVNGNGIFEVEHSLLMDDSTHKHVWQRCEILLDENTGRPIKIIGTIQDITERKKAEEQLRQAHSELRTLFENIREVFFSVEIPSGNLLQMSDACVDVWGYTKAEFAANPNLWFEIILEEDKSRILNNFPLVHAGCPVVQEYRIRHKTGVIRYLESRLTPVIDEHGKVSKMYGITSDISDRKEAERILKESEDKFRSLIKNSADVIMVMGGKSEVLFASDSLYTVTGYTPEEVLGVVSVEMVHPDDQPAINENFKKVLEGTTVMNHAYRRRKKDGTYIWCEGTATNLFDDPAVRGVVIVFRDISERKEYERSLRENEHRFRALIHKTFDAITVLNEHMELVFASDSIYQVTGFRPEEIYGAKGFCFTHPNDQGRIDALLEEVLKEPGRSRSITYRRQKKDGSYIWCERVVTNLLHDPAIKGLVSNIRDVNDKIEYENALKESNEELKKSNMELDRFVYSVSHDLRAPLLSMLGIVDLARMETSTGVIKEYLEMVKGSIHKLDGFIRDILDYSRNARLQVRNEPVKLHELLKEITDHLKYMSDNWVEIRTSIQNGVIFHSDKNRISVVLNNLVSNAIRYCNPDAQNPYVDISVKLSQQEAVIKVKDNGIGIPLQHQDKVFDMFYRVSSNSVGSGLGLYIVKETVTKLAGSIQLHSLPGEGTEFTIVIPNLYTE